MGALTKTILVLLVLLPLGARSDTTDSATVAASIDLDAGLCRSTPEYIKTLKFLRDSKEFSFQEEAARKIANDVSKGCDGAAQRFSQVLLLLQNVGVSNSRSLQMALEFSKSAPDVQKNFLDIFTRSYLSEFFDFEYSKALDLALQLSKDFKGDANIEREDFIALSCFCRDPSSLALPIPFCADYAVEVAKLSQYYKSGVAKPFQDFYKTLRAKQSISLDVRAALELAFNVLKSGPRAPDNFIQAYDFAVSDLKLDKKAALKFSLTLADHSFIGDHPPLQQTSAQAKRTAASTEAKP